MGSQLERIKTAVIAGKHTEIEEFVREALSKDFDPNRIINDALIAAMDEVGRRFADQRIYVPEMLVSAMTMKKGLEILKPLLKGEKTSDRGVVVMATVKGDLHDIGKNLVCMMLEGAGFRVVDLGVDIGVEDLIRKVEEIGPHVLGLSALLTTTMPEMARVIEALRERGLRGRVKVMVGGAPVDLAFAERIGADGYGKDASEAVQLARDFVALK
jgi:5-methyltetrahydrofolate--homocysteine methyltransferase